MKKKKLVIAGAVILIVAVIAGFCVKPVKQFFADRKAAQKTGFYMDTVVTADITGENCGETADAVFNAIQVLEEFCLSKTAEGSDIYELNEKGKYEVTDSTLGILEKSLEVCKKSGGALDIGIGKLVDLWNVKNRQTPPSQEETDALRGSRYEEISVDANEVTLGDGVKIDLGAVGKGAACDSARDICALSGVKRAVISVGGSVLLYGEGEFTVGIASPETGSADYIAVLTTGAGFVSTSGTYERFFDYEGKRYHHILDPETGYPVDNGLCSVTVVSDSGILSDALSTACFVLGLEDGMNLCEEYGCQAVFITDDGKIYTTDGIRDSLEISDDSFSFAD